MSRKSDQQAIHLQAQIAQQRRWIMQCGATRSGYRQRYGIAGVGEWTGDGGDAIYNADIAELARLQEALRQVRNAN